MTDRVWYAAYGSNLSRARFEHYISSGTPDGSTHAYPGCRDASAPADDRPWELPVELAFGGRSVTWGGGVGFVEAADPTAVTKARLYLINKQQFEDLVAQENWLACGEVDLPDLGRAEEIVVGADHTYRLVLGLGELEGHPVVTLTQHRGTAAARPSLPYLRHIAVGLREAHAMGEDEIAGYLSTKRGIAGEYSSGELLESLRR